ncbi:phosphomannomutase a1 [Stylonychia lemnae]|uniref:Phosphomannomutase n=1 Tax=Stylonychia lemnae TaxID=5949 RepID=A0A078AG27_STYLE|nr:phosphomannomutase a1 [Stylonychia lemnae]|eukprot:CDW80402.1 phosphomannomutase a1 [Stylonychia lemnae]
MQPQRRVIALFDVDQTLTPARKTIQKAMVEAINKMGDHGVDFGIVSGSDLHKIKEQVGEDLVQKADYTFSENGLYTLRKGQFFSKMSIKDQLGESKLKKLINFSLRYIADLDIPIKRGTFIEYRTGMINISPIGRNCSREERDEFEEFDKTANVRKAFVEALKSEMGTDDLTFSIGGQISFDVFPRGWDKSFCLQYIEKDYDEIHFFGDKCQPGGNDHEIYADERTIGHEVSNPDDTLKIINELFLVGGELE